MNIPTATEVEERRKQEGHARKQNTCVNDHYLLRYDQIIGDLNLFKFFAGFALGLSSIYNHVE